MENKYQNLRIALAMAWLLLTSALTLWWMFFAMELISRLESNVARHKSMLFWEGATLLGLLLIGGSTLVYFILQEKNRAEKLHLFFAAFTHDVKTRLSGVKLQAEVLKADNKDQDLKNIIDSLLTDTSRLQVQVENSLFVGGSQTGDVFLEEVRISEVFNILFDSWPQLKISVEGDACIRVDRRAFESIITNVLHNSISHGQARDVRFRIESGASRKIRITAIDNGSGFLGEVSRLGEKFYRHNPRSGSGLGLFTARESLKKMDGQIGFLNGPEGKGFVVYIEVPGVVL